MSQTFLLRRRAFRCLWGLILCAAMFSAQPRPGLAEDPKLPVPRFVSLRAGEVNLRAGPGTEYHVVWIYQRKHMPVEVIEEFDTWRRIRDYQGDSGWVHQSMLSGERTAIVTKENEMLRDRPADEAKAIARLEPGVIGAIETCADAWCRLRAGGYTGWLRRSAIWGVYPDETFER